MNGTPPGAPDGSGPAPDAVFNPLTPQDPREISGYRLRARIGTGGMGAVYLSYTPGGRPLALKVARPEFASDPEFRRRFEKEVAIAQRVQGLYTAPVIDSDAQAPRPWMATAYVAAPSLAVAVARQGPLPVESVLVLIAGVAEALQSIHVAGVIHRDLKPGNVILAADGPRVIDFGISRAVEASSVRLTRTGEPVGTPAFMAPEQIRGKALDTSGDVFSLGATAYYAATGELPFGADVAVFHRIVNEQPDWDSCPEQIRGILERCLEKDPAARPTPTDLISLCRRQSTDERLRIGEGWLPPTVLADLTRYVLAPREQFGSEGSEGSEGVGGTVGALGGAEDSAGEVASALPPAPAQDAKSSTPTLPDSDDRRRGRRRGRSRLGGVLAAAVAALVMLVAAVLLLTRHNGPVDRLAGGDDPGADPGVETGSLLTGSSPSGGPGAGTGSVAGGGVPLSGSDAGMAAGSAPGGSAVTGAGNSAALPSAQAVPASGLPAQQQGRPTTARGGVYRIAPDRSGVEVYSGSGTNWVPIGGPTGKLYGGGYGLFATSRDSGDISRYLGSPGRWEVIGGPGAQFVVTGDRLYSLTPDKQGVYVYSGSGTNWVQVGGPGVVLYGGGYGLFSIAPGSGDIYRYSGRSTNWELVGGPGAQFVVTGDRLYSLTPDKQGVYVYSGSGTNWVQVGGPGVVLYGGGYGLFSIAPGSGDIYRYSGRSTNWELVGGPGAQFVVTGDRLYSLTPDKQGVYMYSGSGTDWIHIGGPAESIAPGS
ncbi:serine/threonine-protein kinase [Parafrankia sp. CH37]|nr:serine/threonine-protein kinase [Parafrankia sp. CH37]MBE3203587.1 protein kinase [Parafrankia sp. CH37]